VPDDLSDLTPADLDYDLEGGRTAATRLQQFFGGAPRGPVRTRGGMRFGSGGGGARPPLLEPTGGVGRTLVLDRCRPENQHRYAALLRHEKGHDARDDHGMLIGAACVVLEAEFDHLVTTPAQAIADDLIALLEPAAAARVLLDWRTGAKLATLGTHGIVLTALRRGLEQGRTAVRDLLRRRFDDNYLPLLRSAGPARCLEQIRNRYRNPAMHGSYPDGRPATFDGAAYEAFVRLVVASTGFGDWDQEGPRPGPPTPDAGVFHHHLCHAHPEPRG
jgi:hypothetical protein